MDSKNIEQLDQVQLDHSCEKCHVDEIIADTVMPEQAGAVAGVPLEPKAPEQVFIEWGHLADVNCFCMMVTIPSSGNFRVNFNLAELRGMRDNIVSLIDAYTK